MIWRDRTLRRLAFIAAAVIVFTHLLIAALAQLNPLDPVSSIREKFAQAAQPPVLTQQRLRHITDGDHTGGGHLSGTGAPCKSEFPPGWTREKIARDIPLIAANDNLHWQDSTQGNGYQVADAPTADGLIVRIVVNPRTNEIVTAYPVNVRRNPCHGANDNRRR